jgi:hypothetical protein
MADTHTRVRRLLMPPPPSAQAQAVWYGSLVRPGQYYTLLFSTAVHQTESNRRRRRRRVLQVEQCQTALGAKAAYRVGGNLVERVSTIVERNG